MTGAMRKMGVYLGLVEDDAHDEPAAQPATRERSYAREDAVERPQPARRPERYDYDDLDEAPVAPAAPRAVEQPVRSVAEPIAAPPMQPAPQRITTLHPRTYNEARTLGEQFRDGNPVIMNLTEMEDADAKRLVDFAAGLTFGLRGSIERITTKVFLLSPQKIKMTAEDKARIADGHYPGRA